MRLSKKSNKIFKFINSNTGYCHKPDYIFQFALFIIIFFGLLMLASAGVALSYRKHDGNAYYYVVHQIINGLLPGLVFYWIFSKIDYHFWQRKNILIVLAIFSVVALALVFSPIGSSSNTFAQSWLVIGGSTIQPSELVKVAYFLFLAGFLTLRGEAVKNVWLGFVPFILIMGAICGLISKQPDFGTAMIFAGVSLTMYFIAGARFKHLLSLLLVGLIGVGILAAVPGHVHDRVMTFLSPSQASAGDSYQIKQSLLAVGSGGFWGRGLGDSRQKFSYLPEVHADSIFAVIAEETGFAVSALLIILFLVILNRGLAIAQASPDQFGRLVAIGFVSWFVGQAFFNIGVMLGILPLTGLPLTFISYGGTALMSAMAAAGILVNISRQTKGV